MPQVEVVLLANNKLYFNMNKNIRIIFGIVIAVILTTLVFILFSKNIKPNPLVFYYSRIEEINNNKSVLIEGKSEFFFVTEVSIDPLMNESFAPETSWAIFQSSVSDKKIKLYFAPSTLLDRGRCFREGRKCYFYFNNSNQLTNFEWLTE